MSAHSEINIDNSGKKNRRGRPKGSRTASLSEVRRQANEEKNRIKEDLGCKINELRTALDDLQQRYDEDIARLSDELEALKRREANYQHALGEKLQEVAEHLQSTLLDWGTAELEEAQIDKRGRGRPRKTLK